MKKLLVLTAVAALVATTAVEARGGFGGARGFSGGRSFSKSAPARVYAPSRTTVIKKNTTNPVGALKFFGRRLLERRGRCCSWLHGGQRGLRCSD